MLHNCMRIFRQSGNGKKYVSSFFIKNMHNILSKYSKKAVLTRFLRVYTSIFSVIITYTFSLFTFLPYPLIQPYLTQSRFTNEIFHAIP